MEIDLRRFISAKAQEGKKFKATTWVVVEFNIGNGTWDKVESDSLKINVDGKVPKLETPFSLHINIEKLNNKAVKLV